MTSVSVIICAYTERRWSDLVAALDSVRSQRRPATEIIVVVDHNPKLLERLREQFSDLTLVANPGEPGLAAARNAGVATATASIAAFLDDDAVADPCWLERLVAGYADPNVIAVGGSIDPLWEGGRPRSFPPEFDWVVGCTYRGMPEAAGTVRNLIGANMSFRREVLH